MAEATKIVDERAIEQLISQVRGIMAVRVVLDTHGQIDEIHVVASPDRSAKQMVRDVESIVYVRGNVRVDHRKISLVQLAEPIQVVAPRVLLLGIEQVVDDQDTICITTLAMGDQRVQGTGRNRPGHQEQHDKLVGFATIHALDQLIGVRGQFRLEALQRQSFGHLEVYLAHVTLTTDDVLRTLLGITIVRDDDLAAVSRAILDAVNRSLQQLLGT